MSINQECTVVISFSFMKMGRYRKYLCKNSNTIPVFGLIVNRLLTTPLLLGSHDFGFEYVL